MANRQFVDLTGVRSGRLLVIRREGSKVWHGSGVSKTRLQYRDAQWLVRCDCGNEKIIASRHIRSQSSKSCGCWKIEVLRKNFQLPSGISAQRRVLKSYKYAARERNLPWNIADDEFIAKTQDDCFYCGQSPSNKVTTATGCFTFNGIDRMDNNVGYENWNMVACCGTCNLAKRDMPFMAFVDWIKRAAAYQSLKENPSAK